MNSKKLLAFVVSPLMVPATFIVMAVFKGVAPGEILAGAIVAYLPYCVRSSAYLRNSNVLSRSLSFEQVYKSLRKREAKKNHVDGLQDMIKEYRSLTRNLESHRDAYIAHLSKRDRDHLKPTGELANAIGLALKITDRLCGVKNSYKVLDLDLRENQFGDTPG